MEMRMRIKIRLFRMGKSSYGGWDIRRVSPKGGKKSVTFRFTFTGGVKSGRRAESEGIKIRMRTRVRVKGGVEAFARRGERVGFQVQGPIAQKDRAAFS